MTTHSPSPTTLTLTDWHHAEVARRGADLHYTVDLFGLGRPSGRRVEALREALSAAAILDENVSVDALSHERWGAVAMIPLGMLLVPLGFVFGAGALQWGVAAWLAFTLSLALVGTPSGQASLRVSCPDPESVRRALDATVGLPSVSLRAIEWTGGTDADARATLDAEALRGMRRRADALAAQQGMRVLGLRSFALSAEAPQSPVTCTVPAPAARRRESFGESTMGATPGTQRARVHVHAVFVLGAA
jgi:hypothetical protein